MIDCKQKELIPEPRYKCPHGKCPKPCCEKDWLPEDINWAIVNAYKYLYITEKRLLCSYTDLLAKLHYGYQCDAAAEKSIDKARLLRDSVKRELKRYKYKVKCLCKDELIRVFETIERLEKCKLAATHVQIETDEEWVKRNLLCASREDWEMYATALCALFTLQITVSRQEDCAVEYEVTRQVENECEIDANVTVEDTDCDIDATVIVEETDCEIAAELTVEDIKCNIAFEITKNQRFCDFIISMSVVEAACKMGFKFDVEKYQCKIEWELLLEKNPSCNIDLKTYTSCKEYGITYDLIQLLLDAGLDIQSRDGELFILGLLQEYKLSSLSFSGIPAETEETQSFYSNPKAFVERYLREYNLSELTIKKILEK